MFHLVQLKVFLNLPTEGYGMQVGTERQIQRENASMWIWEEQEWCEVLGCSWGIQERECISMLKSRGHQRRPLPSQESSLHRRVCLQNERSFFLDVDRGKGPLASERKIKKAQAEGRQQNVIFAVGTQNSCDVLCKLLLVNYGETCCSALEHSRKR